jgi:TolB-like protein/DNA-binding winged helix-turn-helix (wHTH) protein/Flp pilus assembly protein TadD
MPAEDVLLFGPFSLDPGRASLSGPAGPLPLRPKSFDVLLYLLRNRDRVISKDELMDAVWPNIFVTENSLVQCISDIRAALGAEGGAFLKTVARRGYMFSAPALEAPPGPPVLAPARRLPRALLAGGMVAAILIALLAGWWWKSAAPDRASRAAKPLSVAVLPLITVGSPDDGYLADGLGEDITAALARFRELTVLSPRTVAAYKGRSPTKDEIARDLRVRYLAEGSVRRANGRLRISIRLADAEGTLLWAEQYEADADEVIAIQDDITRHITGALAVRVTASEQARVAAKPPASLEAYDLVLRGRDLLTRLTRTATSDARAAFERALELDPNYAPAYVGLGRADLLAVLVGWTPDPAGTLRRAEARAQKAVSIDEFSPAARIVLGAVYTRLGEYDHAVETLRQALTLNPSDPEIYAGLGDALLYNGEVEEARTALETAASLDPKLSSHDLFNLGAAYFLLGDQARAAQVYERTVARGDGNAFMHAMLAAIYADAGRKEEARREIAEVRHLNPMFDIESFGTLFRNPAHRDKVIAALQLAGF